MIKCLVLIELKLSRTLLNLTWILEIVQSSKFVGAQKSISLLEYFLSPKLILGLNDNFIRVTGVKVLVLALIVHV